MAVILTLNEDKQPTWRWEGQSGEFIEGVKPSRALRNRLRIKHTNKRTGETDFLEYNADLLAATITNWGGFKDSDTGNEIAYSKELVPRFVDAIVTQSLDIFAECINKMQTAQTDETADPLAL